ncbi:2'-deoxycytidine 5'-triphosphate deaminase [Candidatus Liberibacter solanacearum]|uniref:2'-deoxycytidine 5'-triphosphate deaminase n=1 Tax=Candidatus Liberibacter solanacearum TaxID=556287 RepID=A0A1V2N8B4_9HYPH|nr:2'-deoxycytidine 5'-triphosphate deaminase [Candidatus Liberibacter solanacearum]ONI59564.1 2-deoxycytidine 5-triphosphate deaminase [Candidatus Liberibacter solanacearum]ONI59928.1 2'-deoxycytidine 5'-triphosphate deaminase [Candidatus Liberibacter solanacearum]
MGIGVLPDKFITELVANGEIIADCPLEEDQVQPSSLDLRLSAKAYRVSASFLPKAEGLVLDRIERFKLHEIDLLEGAVLEANCVYIVPLMESLKLQGGMYAYANPKSSIGRIDVLARVLVDRHSQFDSIPANYCGRLYLEILSLSFPITIRSGSRLSQLRFMYKREVFSKEKLLLLHQEKPLIQGGIVDFSDEGIALSVNLKGEGNSGQIIGYRSKRHTAAIDVDSKKTYDIADFWDPLYSQEGYGLVLYPNEFYILASQEFVQIPPLIVAEMCPYNPLIGEFRVHYAGFFDPGFGYTEGSGAKAVLEVRSYVPCFLEHSQIIGRLRYESMMKAPENLYGDTRGSNYQAQGLKLSKHFRSIE